MGSFWLFVAGAATSWALHGQFYRWRQRQGAAQLRRHLARTAETCSPQPSSQPATAQLPGQHARAAPPADAVPVRRETLAEDSDAVIVLDQLEHLQGITPAVARRLNEVGILTYADLAGQPPERLKALVASVESEDRPVQKWIAQACHLANEDDTA